MARLDDLLPQGEFVRWRSPARRSAWPIFWWGLFAGGGMAWLSSILRDATDPQLMLFAAIAIAGIGILIVAVWAVYCSAATLLAVTEEHIVWVCDGGGKVALRDIVAIDAEEGGATLNLHLDGEIQRIEETAGTWTARREPPLGLLAYGAKANPAGRRWRGAGACLSASPPPCFPPSA